jgi:prepilin-type N-terminal cleavage/methylation domain
MHSMSFKFSKGFTLIELIIVLSIVSLLLSVVAPISIKAVDKTEAKTELLNTTKLN